MNLILDFLRAITRHRGRHRYLSTACLHDQHGMCRKTCKFCAVSCICECHESGPFQLTAELPGRGDYDV